MNKITKAHLAAEYIQKLHPGFKPLVAVILGSGLGHIADILERAIIIPYEELPGFPKVTVAGQSACLKLGFCDDIAVLCLNGRSHGYEGLEQNECIKTYIRMLKLLGCQYLLITNASGSLRPEVGPGELMLIRDHINFQPFNPLVGLNDDDFGPRFYPLDQAYDPDMCEGLLNIAAKNAIKLFEGIYISVLGPHFETAAEIRAFRILGADAVGMSTVPEVLVASHCGLKVAAIATITNYATGLSATSHNHDDVIKTADMTSNKLAVLIKEYISSL